MSYSSIEGKHLILKHILAYLQNFEFVWKTLVAVIFGNKQTCHPYIHEQP